MNTRKKQFALNTVSQLKFMWT